ncbi:MAG: hypothetical protein K1X74_12930 [Pirellulales bacterium]|nr:hypothetical protein [Pirellulales bacterium]
MSTANCDLLGLYLHLARAAEQRRRLLVRDKVLVLAAATAQELDLDSVAEYCRQKALAHNPGHLVGRFANLVDALQDDQFLAYLAHQRRSFPRERVEHMLQTLGISWHREREAYYTDEEYAAALLGISPAELALGYFAPAQSAQTSSSVPSGEPTRDGYGLTLVAVAALIGVAYEIGRRFGWW